MQKMQVVMKKNAEQYPIPQTGPGQADPGSGRGRANSDTLALNPMRAGQITKFWPDPGPLRVGPTRAGPALGQCIR